MRDRTPREIVESWRVAIDRAIQLGDADGAYRLARVFVRRCRELGLVRDAERGRVCEPDR